MIADLSGFSAAVEAHGDETAADLAATLSESASRSLGDGDRLVKSMGDAVLVACADPHPELSEACPGGYNSYRILCDCAYALVSEPLL